MVKTPREAHNIGKLGVNFLKLYIAGNDNKTQLNLSLSQLSQHFSIEFIFNFIVASDHR